MTEVTMHRVRCFLPNASDSINGIPFERCADGGVISVEALEDEVARQFDGVNGYALIPVPAEAAPIPPLPPTAKRGRPAKPQE